MTVDFAGIVFMMNKTTNVFHTYLCLLSLSHTNELIQITQNMVILY